MSGRRNRMPGLRQKGGIWYIEKRCRHVPGGWLRGSTGTSSRAEAERMLIRKLADVLEEAKRRAEAILLFKEAAMRYMEEIAAKPSADTIGMHLDQLMHLLVDCRSDKFMTGPFAHSSSMSWREDYRPRALTMRWELSNFESVRRADTDLKSRAKNA
jgi:hypothetical protein